MKNNNYTTVIELRDNLNKMIEEGFKNSIVCYCDIKNGKELIPIKYWGIVPNENKEA